MLSVLHFLLIQLFLLARQVRRLSTTHSLRKIDDLSGLLMPDLQRLHTNPFGVSPPHVDMLLGAGGCLQASLRQDTPAGLVLTLYLFYDLSRTGNAIVTSVETRYNEMMAPWVFFASVFSTPRSQRL